MIFPKRSSIRSQASKHQNIAFNSFQTCWDTLYKDFSLVKLHFWWCSREAENKKGFADTWSNWRIKWRTTKEKQSSRKCNKWTSPTKNQQRAPPSGRKSSAKSSLLLLFLILLSTFLNTQIQISYQLYFFFKSVFFKPE